jgi:hypothetical protein
MRKCNYLYVPSKSTAFPVPTLAKFKNVHKNYVQTSYTVRHPHRTLNLESTDKI